MVRNHDKYHAKSFEQVVKELKSHAGKGLSSEVAKKNLARYGKNEILEKKPTPLIFVFLKQFHSVLIYILIIAGIVFVLLCLYKIARMFI